MSKRLYLFYLLNYRGIHHLISLMVFITMFYFGGFSEQLRFFPFQIFILVCNYFVTNYTLRITKLNETVEEELKRIKNNKDL